MINRRGHDDSAVECHRRSQLPPEELKQEVIRLFVGGETVNHTVFLIDYKLDAGKVCDIIREHIVELQQFVPVGW